MLPLHSSVKFHDTTSHCEKILGVIIDNKLSLTEHIYDCVNRASKICNIIFANIKHVKTSILIKALLDP